MRSAWLLAAVVLTACGARSGSGDSQLACLLPAELSGPLISAHRGGAAYAPENTLAAFQNALRLGADELEMDTQLTADSQLVVIHDDTLDRTTDCSGTVGSMTLEQVQACDAAYWFSPGQATTTPSTDIAHPLRGTGVRVPSLREVLEWHRQIPCDRPRLSIEIKNIPGESNFDPAGSATADVLLPLLGEFGVQDEVVIQSFWPPTLTQVKTANPALTTQFLTTTSTGQTALQNLAMVVAGDHDISAPNFDAPDFNSVYISAAQAAGVAVIPYTADAAEDLDAMATLGVNGVITNFPACALQRFGRDAAVKTTPDGVADTAACPGS